MTPMLPYESLPRLTVVSSLVTGFKRWGTRVLGPHLRPRLYKDVEPDSTLEAAQGLLVNTNAALKLNLHSLARPQWLEKSIDESGVPSLNSAQDPSDHLITPVVPVPANVGSVTIAKCDYQR